MRIWRIDIRAMDRAEALWRIRLAALPRFAAEHLARLVAAEGYVWMGRRNPDTPLRVFGSGHDHGSYISIDRAGIEYAR